MNTQELLNKYNEWELKLSAYTLALNTMGFDSRTIAPTNGSAYRNKRNAYLVGEYFSIVNDEEILDVMKQLSTKEDLDEETKRAINYRLADIAKINCIPKDEYVKYDELASISYDKWYEAKHNNDYDLFEPYLKETILTKKRFLEYRNKNNALYNLALDDYEIGMTMDEYDEFFSLIKEKLVPLIHQISQKQDEVDTSFFNQKFDIEKQRIFMNQMMDYLGFTKDWGYLSESEHPFTSGFSINDVRITTRYIEDNLISSIFSIIHEIGHATYNHQIDERFDGTYLVDNITSGLHESQSRLFENYLGRSDAFWDNNYQTLQNLFPEQLKDVTQEMFVRAINASCPSLIRTEADELTYPIHIYIRYEMEKAIMDGSMTLEQLNEKWKDLYEENLGIRPDTDTDGILQDVHWSDGSFGYFPTYALGSAYAAQFYQAMRKDIDVDDCLRNNNFNAIKLWLKEHIHKDGGLLTPKEVLLRATNEPFNPNYYIDYLTNKYKKLYNID
ncbi:MAG: carboxypeptidase M32 [Erysipelotrichaceae bacterium]|nr:carboxypeptidase M32 [Erysipelotrichaceae bacterium]